MKSCVEIFVSLTSKATDISLLERYENYRNESVDFPQSDQNSQGKLRIFCDIHTCAQCIVFAF